MTDRAFGYDEELLRQCATSNVAAFAISHAPTTKSTASRHHSAVVEVETTNASLRDGENNKSDDESCLQLFQDHADHYGRHCAPADGSFEIIAEIRPSSRKGAAAAEQEASYRLGNKFHNFVRSVVFVHEHNNSSDNNNTTDGDTKSHRVTLNRFADFRVDQVLPVESVWDDLDRSRHLLWEAQPGTFWDYGAFGDDRFEEVWSSDGGVITSLSSSDMIRNVAANLAIGHGSMNKLKPKHEKHHKKSKPDDDTAVDRNIELPLDDMDAFETPIVDDPMLDGVLLSIKESKQHRYDRKKHNYDSKHDLKVDATVVKTVDEDDVRDEPSVGDFETYLDWATTVNPDGVAIVHDSIDQGKCGSCWAFAAAGSLEASASRKAAYDAYTYYQSQNYDQMNNKTVRDEAIAIAQQVELQAIQNANLSIQELLDCDTTADQGCTGGNPLLAFYFIHKYGLTSWEEYPYVGFEDVCKKKLVKHPVATVKSWGIISPNHERHIELALRYIGPVAVGVNGAKSSFLAYSGGIYDSHHCKQSANHALLVTGYGQEEMQDGNITKYWIARNSWGIGWGEGGYVRVKRGDGSKGVPGVCGIARSPSVALGGILVRSQTPSYADTKVRGAVRPQTFCKKMGLTTRDPCGVATGWIQDHKAATLGSLGLFCGVLALWLLSGDYRRRRGRRRARELKRQQDLERQQEHATNGGDTTNGDEASPLLKGDDGPATYGGA